jgi:hypothetical protein
LKTYRAGQVKDPQVQGELQSIEEAANRSDPFAELEYLHAQPVKVRKGMLVLADGTDWDPGSGAGLYRRNEANNAWVFIG